MEQEGRRFKVKNIDKQSTRARWGNIIAVMAGIAIHALSLVGFHAAVHFKDQPAYAWIIAINSAVAFVTGINLQFHNKYKAELRELESQPTFIEQFITYCAIKQALELPQTQKQIEEGKTK